MPTEISRRPVVVGVDGSPSSLAAAEFAADLAVRRGVPLHLVYGYEIPMYGYMPIGVWERAIIEDGHGRDQLDDILATAAKQLRQDHPDLAVETRVLTGSAAAVLIEASRAAAATVVGCRGVGGFVGLLLGSVSAQLSAHGHGPIIVVRPPVAVPPGPEQPAYHPPAGPVVVGVDRSPAAKAAVHFAVDEALSRGVPLIAVHAQRIPAYGAEEVEYDAVLAEGLLAEHILPYANQHPELKVEMRVLESANVEKTMIEVTRDARLVVVGCRGAGGFAGLLLGSVSRALVHHAYAPVAVIHPSEH